MNWAACLLLSSLSLAQMQPGPSMPSMPPAGGASMAQAPAPGEAPQVPKFRLLAVQASKEGVAEPFIDPDIEYFKDVLGTLPYDTFVQVAAEEQETPPGEAITFDINDEYHAELTLKEQTEQGLGVDVLLSRQDGVEAIRASCLAVPNQALIFRGLPSDAGDIVVILGLVSENGDDNQDQSQDQSQDQQDQQEQQQQEENKDQEEQKQEQQQQEQQDQKPQEQQQAQKPKDKQDIEAILDMLEQMDKKEQQDDLDHRSTIDIRGAWW